jgi:glycosyltransferase involved in cell wall biosynthesis
MDEIGSPLYDFCLLIPYYNNLPGLILSLESIVYNPEKCAVLIVDDGSREALRYEDLAAHIPPALPVNIIRLPENAGITKALNTGLDWLQQHRNFRYVARLDCADLNSPDRFQKQIAFLEQHPDIDMVGSWCLFKNFSTGLSYGYRTPTSHEQIIKGMHFRNVFRHSTVMWKTDVPSAAGFYPYDFPHCEDYGFFYQILNKGKTAIIPENLVICEINPKSISVSYRKEQYRSRIRVVREYGNNRLFSLIGVVKLWILMVIPYKVLQQMKKILYGFKLICVI